MARPRKKPVLKLAPDGLPEPVRWRLMVRPRALIGGALVDLALEVLLQQAGIQTLELPQLLRAVGVGVFLGIVMPSIGLAVAVRRANREIAEARQAVATGADKATVRKESEEAHAATGVAVARGAEAGPETDQERKEGPR